MYLSVSMSIPTYGPFVKLQKFTLMKSEMIQTLIMHLAVPLVLYMFCFFFCLRVTFMKYNAFRQFNSRNRATSGHTVFLVAGNGQNRRSDRSHLADCR